MEPVVPIEIPQDAELAVVDRALLREILTEDDALFAAMAMV